MSHLSTKVLRLSRPLQDLLGKSELTRPAAMKEFWAYVKQHNLQDPKDGRIIHPNQQIRDVFNVQSEIKFTQVAGLISKHLEELPPKA